MEPTVATKATKRLAQPSKKSSVGYATPVALRQNDAHSRPTATLAAPPWPLASNTPLNPSAFSDDGKSRMYQPDARPFAIKRQARTWSAVDPAGTSDTKLHSHNEEILQYGLTHRLRPPFRTRARRERGTCRARDDRSHGTSTASGLLPTSHNPTRRRS
jgi:hypothetical protein